MVSKVVKCLLLILLLGYGEGGFSTRSVIGTVNGDSIFEDEVQSLMEKKSLSRIESIDRLILYKLAIQDAKKKKLDENKEVRQETEKILYKHYLSDLLKPPLKLSTKEIQAAYQQDPIVRVRHLGIKLSKDSQQLAARSKMETILEKLKRGEDFKKLVLEYSEDSSIRTAGDLDFRQLSSFGEDYAKIIFSLKVNQVSQMFEADGALHLFQLLDKKQFSELNNAQKKSIEDTLREKKEMVFLQAQLSQLRKNAKVTLLGVSE